MQALSKRTQLIKKKSLFISCIVPVYNEQELIVKFISVLKTTLKQLTKNFEIIIVDDGSSDNTHNLITKLCKNKNIKALCFSRNFGKENALTAGLAYCAGDVAILIDSDFQHPIKLIYEFITKWVEGYSIVYGIQKNRQIKNPIRIYFTRLFYYLIKKISRVKIPANACDFRLLDRKVIDALNRLKERNRFMKGLYAWVGFKSIGIPFNVADRKAGKSSWNLFKLTELAITGITSFSNIPLKLLSVGGLLISGFAALCAIYIVFKTLIMGIVVPGYATILVSIIFFGGIQLFSIGIVGEYIARIFTEVKKRPNYIIEEQHGFTQKML